MSKKPNNSRKNWALTGILGVGISLAIAYSMLQRTNASVNLNLYSRPTIGQQIELGLRAPADLENLVVPTPVDQDKQYMDDFLAKNVDITKYNPHGLTEEDIDFLSRVVAGEEGIGEPQECYGWIVDVIANRVESGRFDNTYMGVMTSPGQFSTVQEAILPQNGVPALFDGSAYNAANIPGFMDGWDSNFRDNVVQAVVDKLFFENPRVDRTGGATFYGNNSVIAAENDGKTLPDIIGVGPISVTGTCGNHTFYEPVN
ncbi:MAG: hypothetical protein EPN86_00460 [Nanoarchaeota archaeon]|nr:MAG: hypothetical protein EPN86_00460 [Nanoarchaeota archaeon]